MNKAKLPNRKRVLAGQLNRAKRGKLTPAGVERLRESVAIHRPWEHSTGPRTVEGKARSATNGKSRQRGEESIRSVRITFAALEKLLQSMSSDREAFLKESSPDPNDDGVEALP